MPEVGFEVRFSGKLAQGAVPKEVLNNLCTLFKAEPEKVKALFSRADAVVWRGNDGALAMRLVAAIEKAGALCRVAEVSRPSEEPGDGNGAGPAAPVTAAPGADAAPPVKAEGRSGSPGRGEIVPKLGRLDMSLTPVACNRIGAVQDGLGTGRRDCPEIAYREIFLVSVFKASDAKDEYRLLLFTTRQKRPFVVNCNSIAYNEFAGASGNNMVSSLRAFLMHLKAMHPGLALDVETGRFVDGAPPLLYTKDPAFLATALYDAADPPAAVVAARPPSTAAPVQAPRGSAGPTAVEASFPTRNVSPAIETEQWDGRIALYCAVLLLFGFAWPLLKHSLVFGNQLIWPWQLMGLGMDAQKAAAMATVSTAVSYLPWALVPPVTALLTLAVRATFSGKRRHLGFLAVGAASSTVLFTLFPKESELYGLMIIPPTVAGGAVVLATVFCGSLIAATNHTRKYRPAGKAARRLSGAGGAGVLLATVLAIAGSDWKGWGIYLLYLLMLAVGGLGLWHAFKEEPAEESLRLVSLATRALLLWAPFAAAITQSHSDSGFVQFVVGAGGGTANLAMSAIKAFAVYYGCAFLMALGLAGVLRGTGSARCPSP